MSDIPIEEYSLPYLRKRIVALERSLHEYKDAEHRALKGEAAALQTLERVRELPDKWRETANNITMLEDPDNYAGILNCADELQAELEARDE